MNEKSWFDSLSEILSQPLPGTEQKQNTEPDKPVVFTDDDDDDSLLDSITDILTKPLPGTVSSDSSGSEGDMPQPENPGEAAVHDAEEPDADPVSTTAAAGADWMQREYERFNTHQEQNRQAFTEQQRIEQQRFAAYQQVQLEQFMKSQERERGVFKHHQEVRSQMWRHDLRQAYRPPAVMPQGVPAPYPPGMMPPAPPPPWWRKR